MHFLPVWINDKKVETAAEALSTQAPGPDGISSRVLSTCARQLTAVLQHLVSLSLHQEKTPVLQKTSCLVPVPKKTTPSGLNDYRPVALTSQVMKVLERLVLAHLKPQVKSSLDPPSTPTSLIWEWMMQLSTWCSQHTHIWIRRALYESHSLIFPVRSTPSCQCLWGRSCTPLTFSTTLTHASCRSSLMTLQWLGV